MVTKKYLDYDGLKFVGTKINYNKENVGGEFIIIELTANHPGGGGSIRLLL